MSGRFNRLAAVAMEPLGSLAEREVRTDPRLLKPLQAPSGTVREGMPAPSQRKNSL